jgi:Arc/MetJ-type ribon-helix-helix transcriptional regulator
MSTAQMGTPRSKSARTTTKAMTLRLPAEQAAELEAVARADRTTVSEAVREAIDKLIAERRGDKEFQARLRTMMQEDRKVLERLAR